MGAVTLPACQLPTGSSPCTSLSANSSIMLRSYSSMMSILSPSMPAMAGHLGEGTQIVTNHLLIGV